MFLGVRRRGAALRPPSRYSCFIGRDDAVVVDVGTNDSSSSQRRSAVASRADSRDIRGFSNRNSGQLGATPDISRESTLPTALATASGVS